MVAATEIQRYCDAVADAVQPERIILFGSHAYGTPHADSDVDVLVIVSKNKSLGRRPSLTIRRRVPAGFPVDILVRQSKDVARRLKEGDSFLNEILSNGRVMYEAGHA